MASRRARREPGPRIARLTVDQVDCMLEAGILSEGAPIELIDGVLVHKDRSDWGEDPMTIGKKHNLGVQLLGELDKELTALGCYVQTQGPIRIPPHDEPEPDGAVVRGTRRDYADRLPSAADVHAVIEVADSSLQYDRTTKLALYARAGIAQYVIVDLRHGCVEIHERPDLEQARYESTTVVRAGDKVALRTGDSTRLDVDATSILP